MLESTEEVERAMGEEPHRLIVVDAHPGAHAQQPAVRLELQADVVARCKETGQEVLLARGRYIVVEQSVLQTPEATNGVWS